MKAVFLDRDTFSPDVCLDAPNGLSDYVVFANTPNETNIIVERCIDADIIITNKVKITQEVIARLPNLKLIQLTATGKNNVDEQVCDRHGVQLTNVVGYSVGSVPEHTLMMMLTVMRAGMYYHQAATDGRWQADGRFCLLDVPLLDLAGRTLGIVGKGVIGQKVGQLATAFGMQVVYADRQGHTPRAGYVAFDEMLACADVISLHCPLTDETHHLINENTIAKMTKKPLIVNVARGAIVDGAAIAQALDAGQILGYASDVFEDEPFCESDVLLTLKEHPRVFFTPHNAWGSQQAQARLWSILSQQVSDFIVKNSIL